MTTRADLIQQAIRAELARHPAVVEDDGLTQVTFVVALVKGKPKKTLFKPELRRDLP